MINRKVLLLNAGEEIMRVISWQRAVVLLMSGKAHKPYGHNDEYEIVTCAGIFRLPTALVLMQYIRVPYKDVAVNKSNVLKRDNYTCQYCSKKLNNTTGTVDHIHPQSLGGGHEWLNVVASCTKCNNKKDNLTLGEAWSKYKMKLIDEPFVPNRDLMSFTGINLNTKKMWSRWISL